MAVTDKIVSLLIDIYKHLVAIGYLEEDDINWPPHDPRLPVQFLRDAGFTEPAIDFLQSVPYPKNGKWAHVDTFTFFVDWNLTDMIPLYRYSYAYIDEKDLIDFGGEKMPGNFVNLTSHWSRYGCAYVVNVDTGEVVVLSEMMRRLTVKGELYVIDGDEGLGSIENATPGEGVEFLDQRLADLRSLKSIPDDDSDGCIHDN